MVSGMVRFKLFNATGQIASVHMYKKMSQMYKCIGNMDVSVWI